MALWSARSGPRPGRHRNLTVSRSGHLRSDRGETGLSNFAGLGSASPAFIKTRYSRSAVSTTPAQTMRASPAGGEYLGGSDFLMRSASSVA
jgi:hypothetical protein